MNTETQIVVLNHHSIYKFSLKVGYSVPLIATLIHKNRLQSCQNRNSIKELKRE
jgi:hypothetical protein